MKIGIYTIYDAYNYGSFLQAYALQEYLTDKGHEVTIVKCPSSFKSVLTRKYLAKNYSRQLLKLKRLIAYRKGWKRLNIKDYKVCDHFDLAIIGSDEVWNIENNSFDHHEQFYGINSKSNVNIAYAASLGYSTIKSYEQFPNLKKALKSNIQKFGTRDLFSKQFLYEVGIENVMDVCDPTILLFQQWEKYEEPLSNLNSPYLVYYSYNGASTYMNFIKKFAVEKGLQVIVPGFDYAWCDKSLIISPFEFLSLIKNAEYVVTSTFHGTVFSTLYNKKIITVDPARKVTDYLNQLGLSRNAQENMNYGQFKELLEQNIDYSQVNNRLRDWKLSSGIFFDL